MKATMIIPYAYGLIFVNVKKYQHPPHSPKSNLARPTPSCTPCLPGPLLGCVDGILSIVH
jgi:hypothetical protein